MMTNDQAEAGRTRMRPDAIVDCRLYVKHAIGREDRVNAAFFGDPANKGHLASQLLLYEHILIPTNDFAAVPALINWLGLENFEEALDSKALGFLRRRGVLGYLSEGNGLNLVGFTDSPENPYRDWWRRTLFGDISEAVELQLRYGAPNLDVVEQDRILEKVLMNSKAVELDNDVFINQVTTASYNDIADTPELLTFFSNLAVKFGHKAGDALAMNRLPGIGRGQMLTEAEGVAQDPIQLVLKVGEVNMQLVLADFAGGTDLHVSPGAEQILRQKLVRAGLISGMSEGFARILKLKKIPDIRVAVQSGSLTLEDIWDFRRRRVAKRFRKWLSEAKIEEADDLERLYVESLENSSFVDSLPSRIIRFVVTTAAGVANPIVGGGVGIADSFFVSRFLGGYHPKLMFDRLAKLFPGATGGEG
jgi:hypothetical protein